MPSDFTLLQRSGRFPLSKRHQSQSVPTSSKCNICVDRLAPPFFGGVSCLLCNTCMSKSLILCFWLGWLEMRNEELSYKYKPRPRSSNWMHSAPSWIERLISTNDKQHNHEKSIIEEPRSISSTPFQLLSLYPSNTSKILLSPIYYRAMMHHFDDSWLMTFFRDVQDFACFAGKAPKNYRLVAVVLVVEALLGRGDGDPRLTEGRVLDWVLLPSTARGRLLEPLELRKQDKRQVRSRQQKKNICQKVDLIVSAFTK